MTTSRPRADGPGLPWHVSDALARRYADGSAAETDAWSLEKHVESCGDCAGRVSAAVRAGTAGPVLASVRAELLASLGPGRAKEGARSPRPGTASGPRPVPVPAPTASPEPRPAPAHPRRRFAAAVSPGRRPGPAAHTPTPLGRWARLWWAVGPALRGSWVVAVLLVVGGAYGLAHGAGVQGARSLLLALSPVLPLAGVAVSYGRHADPMHEITASTPSGGLRLLLTRTAAVLAVCVPLLTAGGALLPPVAGFPGAAAWLLPGLALTLATLALGSFVGCRAAAATLGGGWLLAVAGPLLGPVDTAASATALAPYFSGAAAQGGWAAAALACAALLALRRRSFDHLESR
ncbi:zf-HC2 domain-containing protein [Streptomyces sp. NBC_00691]|uniref:zf-HC2 domain-containing protein n=1 Tax=Streptomyces sp. NBC_00691 TaxID=2903671 RepID=UPI002E33053A|nr:zf-HC2 domain-containing protein [Streptomyces sp. NBC_00691]